jgi:histidinol dehydrogenase
VPIKLDQRDKGFEAAFTAFLSTKREVSEDVDKSVREIVAKVRKEGDAALIAFTKQFDRLELTADTLRVSADEIKAAYSAASKATVEALKFAYARIQSHHLRQVPKDDYYTDELGVELGSRWTSLDSVGLYVPGGTAAYPSSMLMNAVPAKVAGVERIVATCPSPDGVLNPLVLVAADIAGVSEIYRIGGAQAIAALAYGTKTIAPVAKIVGPGNAYVAAAKRQVFGMVGIDTVAGPSEVLVIADKDNNPDWIAADLLAQAEHDVAAQSILITDDVEFAYAVEEAIERQLLTLEREKIASQSWNDFGGIILVGDLNDAPPLANRLAAEHVELAIADPEAMLPKIRNAGAIFLGVHTPEVIGDYVGGSNHVLPTARAARHSSGLSVMDFVKRTSTLKLGRDQLQALAPAAMELAAAEGLGGHRRSIAIRINPRERDG